MNRVILLCVFAIFYSAAATGQISMRVVKAKKHPHNLEKILCEIVLKNDCADTLYVSAESVDSIGERIIDVEVSERALSKNVRTSVVMENTGLMSARPDALIFYTGKDTHEEQRRFLKSNERLRTSMQGGIVYAIPPNSTINVKAILSFWLGSLNKIRKESNGVKEKVSVFLIHKVDYRTASNKQFEEITLHSGNSDELKKAIY